MASSLPRELEEEIVSRLPLQALVRFRTVCKQWNSVFNGKSFLKKHSSLSPPQFILLTASKVYSIDIIGLDPNSIDPKIELCLLSSSDNPYGDRDLNYVTITNCDEFLLCFNNWYWEEKAAIWNPWLKQVTWLEYNDKHFYFVGLGYDNSRPDKVYKMLVWYWGDDYQTQIIAIYECASHAFKSIDTPEDEYWLIDERARRSYVALHGNLYWVDYNLKTCEYFIQSFDFSKEIFKPLCLLPCQQNSSSDSLLLKVYEGDRFSLLKQSHETGNNEIWVTKKRIRSYNNIGEAVVVWINFMNLSATNLPTLIDKMVYRKGISYFIYNKTIFMCCGDGETGEACIYIVKEDLCKKIEIGYGIFNFCHCVYTPSMISLPSFI